MRRVRRLVLALVIIMWLTTGRSAAQQGSVVFEHVSVIPMDQERVLADHTVVISEGRISALGPAGQVTVPAGATRIDGRGQFLIPALAEMHAHVPGGQNAARAERVLFLYVASGIGTIRSMQGHPEHLHLRERALRGEIIAPTMYLAGPAFSGQTVTTPEVAAARVREQKQAGYDLLKILPGISRATFDALATAANQAGIRFAGHVPAEVGLARALEAKYWTIDHLDGYVDALAKPGAPPSQSFGFNLMPFIDESGIEALVARTKAAGTWNVPTQILAENWFGPEGIETLRNRPEMKYVDPSDLEQWVAAKRKYMEAVPAEQRQRFINLRRRLIKALHDSGAGLLLGSDAPQMWNVPGFSIHRELATYVAAGLTPYEALATGTRNVAMHFNTFDRTGTIETGKRADLVLLEANPLQDIGATSRIAGVMIGGRWLPKAAIDRRLAEGK